MACVADNAAQTCNGKCGTVLNNCQQAINCGPCGCTPTCGDCLTCQPGLPAGTCVADPAQQGMPCGSEQFCDKGSCLACDVCAEGCDFDSIQAAIDAANFKVEPITVVVCPGAYLNEKGRVEIRDRHPAVTLIGAGDGSDSASNTILQNTDSPQTVVYNDYEGRLDLRGFRITGGQGNGSGGGIYNNSTTTLRVTDCTIVANSAMQYGGGIMNFGSLTFAGSNSVTGNSLPPNELGSGIYIGDGGTLQGREFVTVSGNTPESDQCFGC